MAYPYRLNQQAHDEYITAYERYELKQGGLGDRFMNRVEERLKQISEHPQYYSKRQGNYREAKVEDFPYMIVYEFLKSRQATTHRRYLSRQKKSQKEIPEIEGVVSDQRQNFLAVIGNICYF